MILIIGERIHNSNLTLEKVANWRRIWMQYGFKAAVRTPAMEFGSTRRRLMSVLPELGTQNSLIVNLLSPDNKPGTWDVKMADFVLESFESWLLENMKRVDGIILLGQRVKSAVSFHYKEDLDKKNTLMGVPVISIPHPSMRNRSWNQEQVRQQLETFLWNTQILS